MIWRLTTERSRHDQRASKTPAAEIDDSDDDDDDDDDDRCCTSAATSAQGASIVTRFLVVRDSAVGTHPQERHILRTSV